MKLPRPRFTVRRLMIAVAIVASVFALIAYPNRIRAHRLDLATYHGNHLIGVTINTSYEDGRPIETYFREDGSPMPDSEFRIRQWHERLFVKYCEAALHPWLPVEPDPPEPK